MKNGSADHIMSIVRFQHRLVAALLAVVVGALLFTAQAEDVGPPRLKMPPLTILFRSAGSCCRGIESALNWNAPR